ncbi:uncharacterized protein LOC111035240, partial [Myzus persicae]|uniref:uncharacterized protein LOC111035240 n=1 Tax=Myzus persicae TaxID=13164 RepID=UPI000B9388C8
MDTGFWSTLKRGQVVAKYLTSKKIIFWLYGEEDSFFTTLETQIVETLSLGLGSSIWVFPKCEMLHYSGFCALIRSKLADHAQNPSIRVCDPNMSTQTMVAAKWPRGRANIRSSPLLQSTSGSNLQFGQVRGRGGIIRGRGGLTRGRGGLMRGRGGEVHGRSGHFPPSATIYAEALRSIVSVVQMATTSTNPQESPSPAVHNVFRGRGWPRGRHNISCHSCGAFGHLRRNCPKKC